MLVPETEIIVTKDGTEILRKTVRPGDYVIGREPGCDVRVDVELVSRRHAQITINYDHALVEDLGSSNGTFVNGQPVTETTRLWPNQKIQIGAAVVELRRLKAAPAPDVSLAPRTAAVQRLLPEEFLREKKYDIGKVVAQGGMGAILDATEATIERRVAMKVMLDGSNADDLARFVTEAKITGQLEHPCIVPIYELSVDENGQPFYTMKMVRGITLKKVLELVAEGVAETVTKYPLSALLTIFQKVCDAIAFAHSKGVIHRDLKPENIMLDDFGVVLVMDWGLGKRMTHSAGSGQAEKGGRMKGINEGVGPQAAHRAGEISSFILHPSSFPSATLAGSVMGTPQYMAPEQARGEVEALDARSDIYALGAILYHILALRPAVTGDDAWAVVEKVGKGEVETLTAPKPGKVSHLPGGCIPGSLAAVVRKAMAFEMAQRYGHVADLQRDLEAYQNGFATSAENAGAWKHFTLLVRRHKAASIGVAAVLVLTVGFMTKVISSERKAQWTLTELKETAPTFQAQALALIETAPIAAGAPEKALEHIGHAIALAPESADYLVTRGRILQILLRLEEARQVFTEALARDPAHPVAKANLAVGDAVLRERMSDGTLGPSTLEKLAAALSAQGRNAEALYVTRSLDKIGAGQLAIWNALLKKAGISQTLRLEKGGTLALHLNGEKSLDQVSFLRGIPLNSLFISGTQVSDLSPLAGMPLRDLDLGDSRVVDIAPLHGMPLQRILLPGPVKDISPLRGAPLEVLTIQAIKDGGPTDYSVLRDMPLRDVNLTSSNFSDLRILEGKALTSLRIGSSKVTDLSGLRGMPLETLYIESVDRANPQDVAFLAGNKTLRSLYASGNHQLIDLSALRGLPIESLTVSDTGVADLRPLAGSKVSDLALNSTPFTATEQLAAMPRLTTVNLDDTPVSDLAPLAGSTIQKITLGDCTHLHSVAPLAQLSTLRVLLLPVTARDVEALRKHPALQWLGYGGSVPRLYDTGKQATELQEFWQMHDLEAKLRAAEPDGRLRPSKFPYMQSRFPRARQLGGKWYSHVPGKFTWPEAKQLAADLGGHLATITSQAEYDFARPLSSIGQGKVCWLGGQTDKPGASWRWVTGEPWNYTHWAKWKDGKSRPNGFDNTGKPETVLAFAYFGAIFISPPDLCGVTPDHPDVTGLLVEWED